jgi:hypothetical protein
MHAVAGITHHRNPDAQHGGAAGVATSAIQKGKPMLSRHKIVRGAIVVAAAGALDLLSNGVAATVQRPGVLTPLTPLKEKCSNSNAGHQNVTDVRGGAFQWKGCAFVRRVQSKSTPVA